MQFLKSVYSRRCSFRQYYRLVVMSFSQGELDEIYAFAVQLGKDAGAILLERAQERFDGSKQAEQKHVEKVNAVDLVTQTDEGMHIFKQFCHDYPRRTSGG
jgi:myo-inositol-1(or 4)-monophosphatase